MIKPHCWPHCHLQRQNPSNHSIILGESQRITAAHDALAGDAWDADRLHAFVARFYADDFALFDRHCA